MTLKKKFLSILVLFLLTAHSTFAQNNCIINGEARPCGEVSTWFWLFMGFMIFAFLALFGFWLWALLHAIKNQQHNKVAWILLILFTHLFGAAIYCLFASKGHVDNGLERIQSSRNRASHKPLDNPAQDSERANSEYF